MAGGTYTLLIEHGTDARIEIGALGEHAVPAGWYAYTGSALGPGGFARVDRHERVAAGDHEARHWHVDYVLGHPDASVDHAIRSSDVTAECSIARAIGDAVADPSADVAATDDRSTDAGNHSADGGDGAETVDCAADAVAVDGFGSSDCDCGSHLAYHPNGAPLLDAVVRAHRAAGSAAE